MIKCISFIISKVYKKFSILSGLVIGCFPNDITYVYIKEIKL